MNAYETEGVLTGCRVLVWCTLHVFRHHGRESCREMPVDVTVDEPRPRVICFEPDDGRVVLKLTQPDHIATNRILIVVFIRPSAANDREGVLESVIFGQLKFPVKHKYKRKENSPREGVPDAMPSISRSKSDEY